MSGRLPDGFRVALAPTTRVYDDGRLLIGGSPPRALRLSPTARAVVAGGSVVVSDETSAAVARRLLDAGMADPDPRSLPLGDPSRLTVVIPAKDRAPSLARTLGALGTTSPVIVVDDGSDDPAAVAAVVARAGARLVRLEVNGGPARARNAGLALVDTAFVAFVDSDVMVGGDQLAELLRFFADPDLAAVAPRVVGSPVGGRGRWFERYDAAHSALDLGTAAATVAPGGRVAYVPSACLVARTALLGDGFDPALRVGEDVDLVWRLTTRWQVRYAPHVVVRHATRDSFTAWLGRSAAYGTSASALALRHGARVAPAVYSLEGLLAASATVAQRRWSAPVALGAVGVHAWRLVGTASGSRPRQGLPVAAAARLAGESYVQTIRQTAGLLLRHAWPVAALASLGSRRVRRAVVVAAVVDAVVDSRRRQPDLDRARYLAARRLDDLAYGAGLWHGAWAARTTRALRPRLILPRGAVRRAP